MKIVLLTLVLLALGCRAFQVTSPKLVFGPDETGLSIEAPSGGQFDDFIFTSCRKTANGGSQSTPLYKKKADGTYEMFLFPELQVCAYSFKCATTNGKWIFVSGFNGTSPTSSFSAFYSFANNESNLILATRVDEDPFVAATACYSARFISEDTLVTVVRRYADFTTTYQFVEWNYDGFGWNITLAQDVSSIDYNNITTLTTTSFGPPNTYLSQYIGEAAPLFSKQQETDQWAVSALFGKGFYESYEAYNADAPIVYYNGNNTVIYLGGSSKLWSSGTIYIADYQKSNNTWHVVKKFNSEDANLDNEYLNTQRSWVNSVVWINQDMAFLMAPNFPFNYNDTEWMYGGSVVMMYRNKSNQWQMGGRITLPENDGSGEAVQLKYLTRTKTDIVVTGYAIATFNFPIKYFLYTYPLCFPNKMNFTCHQNVSVTSCGEADVTLPNDVRAFANYTDDNCGEPFATVSHVDISDGTATADLKFERLGFEVGQCTATFFCPPPPPLAPPVASTPQKVSKADSLNVTTVVTKLILVLVAISLAL